MLFRSKTSNVVLAKVWGSVLCAGFALLIVGSGFSIRRCLLALPLVVFFGFTASLASLELRDGILRYRRLFKWSIIPDGAIVDARIEWPPVIGSVRLERFVFPWGRLYFVLDGNTDLNPFHEGEYPLLRAIRKRSGNKTDGWNSQGHETRNDRWPKVRIAFSALAGALFYGLTYVLKSLEGSKPAYPLGGSSVVKTQLFLIELLENPKVVLVLSVAFAFMAIYRYRKNDAWIFAFLAGYSLPHIIVRWFE